VKLSLSPLQSGGLLAAVLLLSLSLRSSAQIAGGTPPPANPTALAWDADMKEYHAKLGDPKAEVFFLVTNTSPAEVVVNSVHTSCGCTTAHLPPMPWKLAPGADGRIDVSIDLTGKTGLIIKTVTVASTAGAKELQIRVFIPDPQVARMENMQLAQGDRQAVFKDSCVRCHVTPGVNKRGAELFHAVCGVCHEAVHRASMVPDLHHLNHPTSADHWRIWITSGKPDSLMPAFSQSMGGPLTDEQIESLVDYLVKANPSMDANGTPASH